MEKAVESTLGPQALSELKSLGLSVWDDLVLQVVLSIGIERLQGYRI